MASIRTLIYVIEAVSIFAGLIFYLLGRMGWSGGANSGTEVVRTSANAQEKEGVDTEQSSSSSSASDSVEEGQEFEVFLSFRGPDIRKSFADCLYHSLTNVRVRTFRDNEEIRVGEELGTRLMRAIKQSKIFIPIFTKGYASSRWCLMELAEMVKCKEQRDKFIIKPIFFDVTPDEVKMKNNAGRYKECLDQHEKQYDFHKVKGWRDALKRVAKLKGLELCHTENGDQGAFIKLVVDEVLEDLKKSILDEDPIKVGLDHSGAEVKQLLQIDPGGTHMVALCGLSGIGKTTLGKHVYNQVARNFNRCSFLSDIRAVSKSKGLPYLQTQLISDILGGEWLEFGSTHKGISFLKERLGHKKAFIFLDDIDDVNQLEALAGSLCWFGSGSRILVTTQNKGVLQKYEGCKIYEVKPLDEDHALELFCKYAFQDVSPMTEFDQISKEIVGTAGGFPLALKGIGLELSLSREKEVWSDMLKQLKRQPHETVVLGKIRDSYNALDRAQKIIFLDIACFFIGVNRKNLILMWDTFDELCPSLDIQRLQSKCLINIGDDEKLNMHQQVRDLGRHMVEKESKKGLGNRSRVWRSQEAVDLLRNHKGTSKVEAVAVQTEEEITFSHECFINLEELRILKLYGDSALGGSFQNLLQKLGWLTWKLNNMSPPEDLHLEKLIVLDLSGSSVDKDWVGWQPIKMKMAKLKVLDVSWCKELECIPDFTGFPNLERLIMDSCLKLDSIDSSIRDLKKLNFLNMRKCIKLKKLPDELGNLEELIVLIVDQTSVEEIPITREMRKLEIVSARYCARLSYIPEAVGFLVKFNLKRFFFEGCSALEEHSDSMGELSSSLGLGLSEEFKLLEAEECFSVKVEFHADCGKLQVK